jgi:hypothetical protein
MAVPPEPGADPPRRAGALVRVELTAREARSLIRATTLVADVLRPDLLRRDGVTSDSPLITAYQALIAACERCGVDLGLAPTPRREPA